VPTTIDRARQSVNLPHAFLLAACVPLFLGAALADYAYASTYHVQWTNFASWLIVGGLVFGGAALVCALIDLLRAGRRGARFVAHFVLLLAAFVLGVINAFVHAADAWASMPTGLVLSLAVTLLAGVATAIGFSIVRTGSRR
jgi:uncharacterized membrane protein